MLRVEHLDVAPEGFLSEDPEDWQYHRAFQDARLPDFQFGYYRVWDGDRQLAVLPYFLMQFQLNTMLPDGWLKDALRWLRLTVACVGHPSTDLGHLEGTPTADVLAAVNAELFRKSRLVAYKGFSPDLPLTGFVKVPGLPVALLRIKGDFWSGLKSERRNNLKRKTKKASHIQVVERQGLTPELVPQVHRLYLNTYERAKVKFEVLTEDYFTATSHLSKYLLFYDEGELIGFVQLFCKSPRMVLRYLGLDYRKSQEYGLYFLLFLRAIEVCVRDGLSELESGATSYDFKKRIGSEMLETWVYYKHSNPMANWALEKLKFLLEPSAFELE